MTSPIESRAAAYLAKLPPAVAGNAGHRATFAAACRLVEFGLPFERALLLLLQWNETHCQPKWTAADLSHKLADAFKRTTAKPEYMTGRRAASAPVTYHRSTPVRPDRDAQDALLAAQLASQIKLLRGEQPANQASAPTSALRQVAEALQLHVTYKNISALATLRGLHTFGLHAAHRRGLLQFSNHFGKPAWFILDRSLRNACARRMDGLPWNQGMDGECKAMILRGAQAKWPIGIREAQEFPKILLCEGAPDFLAAFHYAFNSDQASSFAPVAMLSAAYPIHTDALRLFKGKRVRIYAHADNSGVEAAARWSSQIGDRATVDTFLISRLRVKDLNDAARAGISGEHLLP